MKKYNVCFVCKQRKVKDAKICFACLSFLKYCEMLTKSVQMLADVKKINKRIRIAIETEKRDRSEILIDKLQDKEFNNLIFN